MLRSITWLTHINLTSYMSDFANLRLCGGECLYELRSFTRPEHSNEFEVKLRENVGASWIMIQNR
jgi:hypothetical protein